MCADKLTSEARKRQTSGPRHGATAPATLKSAERGETAEKIATIARVGRDLARRALRAHRDGHTRRQKPSTPRPPLQVDRTKPEYVIKRFQKFFDHWPVAEHRAVREVLLNHLENRT
jgi:hypothetical protein